MIIEKTKQISNKNGHFSKALRSYEADILKKDAQVEVYFMKDQLSLEDSLNKISKKHKFPNAFSDANIKYVEKTTVWNDGQITVHVNDEVLNSIYQTLEGVEGLAQHSLYHIQDDFENNWTTPHFVSYETLKTLFPSYGVYTSIELFNASNALSSEFRTVNLSLNNDVHSALAEDFENTTGSKILRTSKKQVEETVRNLDELIMLMGRSEFSRFVRTPQMKKYFFKRLTHAQIGKHLAVLTNPQVPKRYKDWLSQRIEDSTKYEEEIKLTKYPREFRECAAFEEKYYKEFLNLLNQNLPQTTEQAAISIRSFLK